MYLITIFSNVRHRIVSVKETTYQEETIFFLSIYLPTLSVPGFSLFFDLDLDYIKSQVSMYSIGYNGALRVTQ